MKKIIVFIIPLIFLIGCGTSRTGDLSLPGRLGLLTVKVRTEEGVDHACRSAGIRVKENWQIKGCAVGDLIAPTIIVREDFWELLHEIAHLNNPQATENEVRELINDPRYPPTGKE